MNAPLISEAAKARAAARPTGTVQLEIDGQTVTVPEDYTIWQAAREQGKAIPVLCHDERMEPVGVCRMCVVEVEGARVLQASCVRQVEEGMIIRTDSEQIRQNRKVLTELMMSDQHESSAREERTGDDELFDLARELDADSSRWPQQNGRKQDGSSDEQQQQRTLNVNPRCHARNLGRELARWSAARGQLVVRETRPTCAHKDLRLFVRPGVWSDNCGVADALEACAEFGAGAREAS